jgi:hypothetical protein
MVSLLESSSKFYSIDKRFFKCLVNFSHIPKFEILGCDNVPLAQMVRCKGLWRLPWVIWLSVGFLIFFSLTQHRAINLLSFYVGDGWRLGEQVVDGLRSLTTHDRWQEMVLQPHSPFSSCCLSLNLLMLIWMFSFTNLVLKYLILMVTLYVVFLASERFFKLIFLLLNLLWSVWFLSLRLSCGSGIGDLVTWASIFYVDSVA